MIALLVNVDIQTNVGLPMSVCRCSESTGRSSCSIVSGDILGLCLGCMVWPFDGIVHTKLSTAIVNFKRYNL